MHFKILFLIPYPRNEAPSQRFRFEQYFEILKESGLEYEVQSFLSSRNWQIFYKKGETGKKLISLFTGFARRIKALGKSLDCDIVFIHRETTPLGPPVFEWILAKILRKKIIYDFDDALWLTDRNESSVRKILKFRSKIKLICRWAWKVSCGNNFLMEYAKQYNERVFLIPTTIHTEKVHNPSTVSPSKKISNGVTIGWTGSHSTLKYLRHIDEVLERIVNENISVGILIIADKKPELKTKHHFHNWHVSSEIADLMHIDIGIMPLTDDDWSRGKCGFKALQYMAMEKPAVASPVGVNKEIIENGVNGFLCKTTDEWYEALKKLISDPGLREKFGKAGRKKVIENYSVKANARAFLSLFENS